MKIPFLGRLGAALLKASGYGTTQGYSTMSPELIKWFGGPTASGKSVTESTVMALTAMWGCSRILAESVASIPWHIYRKQKKNSANADVADDHQLSALLNYKPNKDMTRSEFKEALVTNLCQAGNAYCFRDDLGGKPVSLYPLRSSTVQARQKQSGNTKLALPDGSVFYSVLDRGKWEDYPREKVWHVKGFGNDGLCGFSPIGVVREAFGSALAADEFGARFFGQGGKPSGVVTIPNWLTDDQRSVARENLSQMLGGVTNAHKFALFEGGMKPEPWGELSLDDLQFVMLRRFNVQEIARIYRVPPHMLADLEKGASYASIEQMSSEFVTFTLMPYFTRIEASAQRWLLGPDEQDYFLRFNYEALLRADSESRAKFYASALQNGWLNRNEVRAMENRNSVDGLDDYTVQTNLTPADMLAQVTAALIAGKQPQPAAEPSKEQPKGFLEAVK